jgi:8-oxo-dGTP pyrophosphatase MutT (NUDIX family)
MLRRQLEWVYCQRPCGEAAETAALRELKEETGYVGVVCGAAGPPLPLSPGLCDETVQLVRVDVVGSSLNIARHVHRHSC